MKTTPNILAVAVTAAMVLGGCAAPQTPQVSNSGYQYGSPAYPSYYGVVDSIQLIAGNNNSGGPGVGAVVGGVVGGILGNQVGAGSGKSLATVAGVVGGAVVGNQIEQHNRAQASDSYQITVRLNSGGYQSFQQDAIGDMRPGSRVRIENGRVYAY